MQPNLKLNLLSLARNYCYGWYRKDHYLYIGLSKHGLKRLIDHHVIDVAEQILPDDEFHIWFSDAENLTFLERRLIALYKPSHQRLAARNLTKKTCEYCTVRMQVRPEKRAICIRCRRIHADHDDFK